MKPVPPKSLADVQREWDRIASLRYEQIDHGRDLSYIYVLRPSILARLHGCGGPILDVGCGVGLLTVEIANQCGGAIGIDISPESIALAQTRSAHKSNVTFACVSVEEFANTTSERFSAVVANMMLMTTPNLYAVVRAITRLLRTGGRLILTIPHPCFWPIYWKYEEEDWFNYSNTVSIEARFSISSDGPSEFVTTHIHRPLEQYFSVLAANGLSIETLTEPRPPESLDAAYLKRWRYPHFVLMVCTSPA
jgi:SAM-dependent methyltransferase